MTSLIPRDHFFQDLFDFRRDFDQIFNRFLSWPSAQGESVMTTTAVLTPPMECFVDKDGKKFHCNVMLPGVDPKDVSLQVQGNTLTISGERSASRETKETDYLRREITYGAFQRSILLPEGVDSDKLTAEYRNGILEITAPIAAAALPRKVEIKALPGPAARHAAA
jgi:HSP20 family protein